MAQLDIAELQKWKNEIEDELANLKSASIEKEVDALQSRYSILSKVDLRLTGKSEEQELFQKKYLDPTREQLEAKKNELEKTQNEEYQTDYFLNKILNEVSRAISEIF